MLHDRSASREEEEAQYFHSTEVTVQHEAVIADQQWTWLADQLGSGRDLSSLRILDIGCGKGAFLLAARAAGVRKVAGLELDPSHVSLCQAQGLDVRQGSLFDAAAPGGLWDVVTFWDVLDHLEYPNLALELIRPTLAAGALVVLRGRNGALHAPLKRFARRCPGVMAALRLPDVSVVHRWGIPPAGWLRLLETAGFDKARLYPGLPTPGDRYRTLGPVAAMIKGLLAACGRCSSRVLGLRGYWYPSVLVTGVWAGGTCLPGRNDVRIP